MNATPDLAAISRQLTAAVRNIPDWPKPGIQFKDITPILSEPRLLALAVEALAAPFENEGITKVMGIEARGFILGAAVAQRLGAGFIPVRKRGKLPYRTVRQEYALEYGTDEIEMHVDALHAHDRVLIHDDVIATGGTATAAYKLAAQMGGEVVAFAFLVELGFLNGRDVLGSEARVHSVLSY